MSGVGLDSELSFQHMAGTAQRKSGGLVVCFLVSRDCIIVINLIYSFLALFIYATLQTLMHCNYTIFTTNTLKVLLILF